MITVVIIVVLVVGGVTYVLLDGSTSSKSANLLANAGFETGDLRGWQTLPTYPPAIESTIVPGGASHAARFQTPTNDPAVSGPCLTSGSQCGLLNVSTIYQNINNFTLSQGAKFSLAVDPAFQYPSAFQVTLEFGLSPSAVSQTGHSDVFVYYLVLASSQQCTTYSGYLVRSSPSGTTAAVHCLTAPIGTWTSVSRQIGSDLPSGVTASELNGSQVTLSVSFAGASPTDQVYLGALYFG